VAVRDEAAKQSRAVFDAAADHYDDEPLAYLTRFGRRSVEHARVGPGDRVLDVACGSGASALPAAEKVGPNGRVLAVDVSERLLALARAKAEQAGLDNLEFRLGDMRDLELPAASFDAVQLVFGVFFVPDMEALTRELWSLVKPGGRLVITVWARGLMEPAYSAFFEAVGVERPDLVPPEPRWMRVADPPDLRATLVGGGIPDEALEIVGERGVHELPHPDEFWTIVEGSGMRGSLDPLPPDARERIRRRLLAFIETKGITRLPVDVFYGTATKPG
jgi:ubiquinone/menaquinone biosynthesis C-methylase UbiE